MRPALFVIVAALAVLVGCAGPSATVGGDDATQRGLPGAQSQPPGDGYTLSIERLGIAATPLMPVGLHPDGTMVTPPVETPEQAAVFDQGPMPGQVGPAVIIGHVNGNGRPGVFARLAELREGDVVETSSPDGTSHRFEVYKVQAMPKSEFETASVYSDVPGPELRLITCSGSLDRTARSYTDNTVVFARQV
jgi:hypothetical protein